jgi:hypothetical protein
MREGGGSTGLPGSESVNRSSTESVMRASLSLLGIRDSTHEKLFQKQLRDRRAQAHPHHSQNYYVLGTTA